MNNNTMYTIYVITLSPQPYLFYMAQVYMYYLLSFQQLDNAYVSTEDFKSMLDNLTLTKTLS